MQFGQLKRREFIRVLGGAAAIWPFAATAQQAPKTAKVGILYPGMAATLPSRLAGLREALQSAGYREPDSLELVARAAEGDPKRIVPLAKELASARSML
jgi:putative tryptophan/tyrosine transport system substrate-binding protein